MKDKAQTRRDFFPRGLKQPAQGFRFSLDSLLLACYPRLGSEQKILDIGTGCGVVGLAMLLRQPSLMVTGIDRQPEMIDCARENAQNLNFQNRFRVEKLDVRDIKSSSEISPESFDQVIINPPYRNKKQGRISPYKEKNPARFEPETGLDCFVQAGTYALKNRGVLTIVYLAERLAFLFEVMHRFRLEPKSLRTIHSKENLSAYLVLLKTIKNGGPGLSLEPPMYLYKETKDGNVFTPLAWQFCPFLVDREKTSF